MPVKKTEMEQSDGGGEPGKIVLESNRVNSRSFKRTEDSRSGQGIDVELLSKIRTNINICSWQK